MNTVGVLFWIFNSTITIISFYAAGKLLRSIFRSSDGLKDSRNDKRDDNSTGTSFDIGSNNPTNDYYKLMYQDIIHLVDNPTGNYEQDFAMLDRLLRFIASSEEQEAKETYQAIKTRMIMKGYNTRLFKVVEESAHKQRVKVKNKQKTISRVNVNSEKYIENQNRASAMKNQIGNNRPVLAGKVTDKGIVQEDVKFSPETFIDLEV